MYTKIWRYIDLFIAGISQAHDHGQCPDSLQLDLHVEGSGPITLLVRDESRSNKSYQPPESPGHMASSNVCGDTCCPQRNTTVKQVSWGSTSSLANNEMVRVIMKSFSWTVTKCSDVLLGKFTCIFYSTKH